MNKESGKRKLSNAHIIKWVDEMAALTRPDHLFWCDGSDEEKDALTLAAVEAGVLIELNQKKLSIANCYPTADVLRVEHVDRARWRLRLGR